MIDKLNCEFTIEGLSGRIYFNTEDECTIGDSGIKRKIRAAKAGIHTAVVWNPQIVKSRRMTDFSDEGYLNRVCIETANATDDICRVPHGGEHTTTQSISTGWRKRLIQKPFYSF